MKINKELVMREIAGDFILVPVGNTILENNGLFVLSEVGARIWEILPEACDENDIVNVLLEEYDVDRQTLADDVAEFTGRLRELGITD